MGCMFTPLEKGRDFALYNCNWCSCIDKSFHNHDHLSKRSANIVQNKPFELVTTNQPET